MTLLIGSSPVNLDCDGEDVVIADVGLRVIEIDDQQGKSVAVSMFAKGPIGACPELSFFLSQFLSFSFSP